MNLALEKIVALVIFLVILIVLIIFTDIPRVFAGQINSQQEIRKCCNAYVGNGCPHFTAETPGNLGDYQNISSIYCNPKKLDQLVKESNMTYETLKIFCACP